MNSYCPICSGSDVGVYLDETDDVLDSSGVGSSRMTISPGTILRCNCCGFGFRKSRLSQEQLANLYQNMDPKVYQSELQGRSRTAERHLRIVEENADGGLILDIGCASGLFLAAAADAGWLVTGIEPSEVLRREAMERLGGCGTVLPLTLEEADLGDQQFDAITMWDVLEHVAEPMETMKRCRALLKSSGCLFLNVPDIDSIEAKILGKRWPLLLPEHLNYFNRPSLKLCGEKSGLQLLRFGRRRSFFSVQYVLYRLSQHRIPAAKLLLKSAQKIIGRMLIPVPLGETYAVFRRA